MISWIDSIAVSVFVVILVEFDKYWDGCGDPLRAAAESLKSLSLDSIAVSVFVVDVELTNTETAAATPPTVMQKK